MLEAIKKSLGKFDYVLLIMAVYMFSHMEYSNLDIVQTVYIVSFVLWFIMLAVRTFIVYKNEVEK